jgi:glycosyltransferase involved in cell wall biosynthesis
MDGRCWIASNSSRIEIEPESIVADHFTYSEIPMAGREFEVDVSVVMIVRNGEQFLRDAIRSVASQTLLPGEILVVDGDSEDRTVELAIGDGINVVQQPGSGIGNARNHGIRSTRGRRIAFLDCDDIWLPRKLATQIHSLDMSDKARFSITKINTVARRSADAEVHPNHKPVLDRGPVFGWTPSSFVADRTLFDDIGTFDESLSVGTDMDFFARLIDSGLPGTQVAETLVLKGLHGSNQSINVNSNKTDMLTVARRSVQRRRTSTS